MTDHDNLPQPLEATSRHAERRRFLQLAGGASIAAGGLALLSACGGDDDDDSGPSPTPSPTPTPTPTSTTNADRAAVNFALQLEYLQAQYFAYATTGAGVSADLLTGTGTPGGVTGGAPVTFSDPFVAACAREIAAESQRRIAYLRGIITAEAVAQPAINISGAADGPFSAALKETFNPYSGDGNFLLGAFFLQDVIVTAYKGLQPLINIGNTRTGFFGLLGAQSYHAGLIRTTLYSDPALRTLAGRFSDARDSLDGSSDLDQGVSIDGAANITPADGNGIAFSRTNPAVLNVLYVNKASVSSGGFFPAGLNGDLKTSAAN
ncbi:ferritin-like domain-containing protein [Sphingomonas sp. IC4-52]|uniref:ferritin-like domain-containing protein n=1 Tax=Sphingomonas sp. IC4-52 TaxID=2887202 RepID=UPI001D0FB15A|nr:ferritin-like domain-containing protein [Sphingomonas sp. IC4-52]MCC2981515.1 ferritin-like domain-containing protein [Sphingomonas sp. IC4-52]